MAQTTRTTYPDSATGDSTNEWFDACSYDSGTNEFTIDLDSLSSNYRPSDADAAAATGDIREIVFGLLSHLYAVQEERSGVASTDVLAGMVITKTESLTSRADGDRLIKFQFAFTRTVGDNDSYPAPTPTTTAGAEPLAT